MQVRPKKHLGQHFLTDKRIAKKIVDALQLKDLYPNVLEIGPGKGILTDWLLEEQAWELYAVDIDLESVSYLHNKYPNASARILFADFLKLDTNFLGSSFAVIGNFPYSISSQILFRVLELRDYVPEVVGMFQKEVAQRVSAGPSSKEYGILSVLVQAFYEVSYEFTVAPGSFFPAPKVKSGVLRMVRRQNFKLNCDEDLFFKIVKAGFNQRRKTLRNALSGIVPLSVKNEFPFHDKRAEVLNVQDYEALCRFFSNAQAMPS